MKRIHVKAALLLLCAPLLFAGTCSEEKVIEIVVGADVTASLIAQDDSVQQVNTDTVNLKGDDFDLAGELEKNDVDVFDIPKDDPGIKISKIFYKITKPQPGQTLLAPLTFEVRREGVTGLLEIASMTDDISVGSATDWIDISDKLSGPGVDMLNQFMYECLCDLRGETGPITNTMFTFVSTGDVSDGSNVDFEYSVKVTFNIPVGFPVDIPSIFN